MATGRDDEMEQLLTQLSDGKKTSGNPMAIRLNLLCGILLPHVRSSGYLICGSRKYYD
jgi:hypothetical protein